MKGYHNLILIGVILSSSVIPAVAASYSALEEPSIPEMSWMSRVADHKVHGLVTDESGNRLIGVSVKVKGSSVGTVTNSEGRFELEVPDDAVLEFSYIGYASVSIEVGDQEELNVALKVAANDLEQVIVVGYGTEKKKNVTGAVSQAGGEVLENRALPNLTKGLQGVIPNLNLTFNGGRPTQSASYNIRGATSIGEGGSALVLIDGVEGNPDMLNPNDVESVTVLKDAASSAIYGARGAFGVVLITTKSAKKGKTAITYSSNYSFKSPTMLPELVTDGYQWTKMFAEAWSAGYNYTQIPQKINRAQKFSQQYLNDFKKHAEDPSLGDVEVGSDGEYKYYGSLNPWDYLFKKQIFTVDQNLSVTGGSEKASFYVSGRYFNQPGLFKYNSDDYATYNFRAKGTINVFPWLEITDNFSYSNQKYHSPKTIAPASIWNFFTDEMHPTTPMLNPDGTLTNSAAYSVGDLYYGKNGVDFNTREVSNTTRFLMRFFDNHFRIHGDFTFQNMEENQTEILVPVPYSPSPGVTKYVGTTSSIEETFGRTSYLAANLYGEYENTFNEIHHFKAMLGYNFEQSIYKELMVNRTGLVFPDAKNISLATGESINTDGQWNQWDIMGSFFRLNYGYKNKYLLEVNGRYDGSSKFPSNQQFGLFPSVSVGWRISNESFWHVSDKAISDLKLRASYGSLGNGNIAPYSFQQLFELSRSGRVLNGVRPQVTDQPRVVPNGLTWETATTKNIGIDVGFLKNRLAITADMYERMTKNMFTVGPTLPDVFGTQVPKGNYADMKTSGWEFVVTWRDQLQLGTSPFRYSVRLNVAHHEAVITKFNNPDKKLSDYYVGEHIGDIWGLVTDGFWTEENVDEAAKMNAKYSSHIEKWLPGDIKWKDLNGDGVIDRGDETVTNPGDLRIIGNTTPKFSYGINLNGSWNNIILSAFFQGIGTRDWYPGSESTSFWGQYNRPYAFVPQFQMNNIWSEDNPNAYFPRYRGYVALGGHYKELDPQTRYLQNAAYFRLKYLQLGYSLPKALLDKINIEYVRVFVGGENLWVTSPMFKTIGRSIDPEGIYGGDAVGGASGDTNNYPMLKSITFGINITF